MLSYYKINNTFPNLFCGFNEDLSDTATSLFVKKKSNKYYGISNFEKFIFINNFIGTLIQLKNTESTFVKTNSDKINYLDFCGDFEIISKLEPKSVFRRKVKINSIKKLETNAIIQL